MVWILRWESWGDGVNIEMGKLGGWCVDIRIEKLGGWCRGRWSLEALSLCCSALRKVRKSNASE